MSAKIGPLISVGGNRTGIVKAFYEKMVGKYFIVFVNDDVGGLIEAMSYGGNYWTYVFRAVGPDHDVPKYHLSPQDAWDDWWRGMQHHLENVPNSVYIIVGNELDKNKADWLGEFGLCACRTAEETGRRFSLFNFASGEPEIEHWNEPGMVRLLERAVDLVGTIAIGLHEYSYTREDDGDTEAILVGYPWMVGRFWNLIKECERLFRKTPDILIGEWGWEYDNIPDRDRAIRDIVLGNELYEMYDEVLGAGLWYSGSGFRKIADQVQKIYAPWSDKMVEASGGDEGSNENGGSSDEIDLADFIVGEQGVQHVLQCRFGDYFQGTQTLRTIDRGSGIFSQQKDRQQEIIYFDDFNVYRHVDTSPGKIDGVQSFYCLYENGHQGSYWCDRFVRVGDVFNRDPLVTFMAMDDCRVFSSGAAESQLEVTGYWSNRQFDGYIFDRPVMELTWIKNGVCLEKYLYGYRRGLIGWREISKGWSSYIVEEHYDRPPMDLPDWPQCMQMPYPSLLYYREHVVEPPETDEKEYDRIFHLIHEDISPYAPAIDVIFGTAGEWRSTVGYSWHDAVHDMPYLLSRTVYAWEFDNESFDKLVAFQERNWPGDVTYVRKYAATVVND